jgi:antirestriction protein ArdC
VTNEIIAELQQGQVLWQKPWGSYGLLKNYLPNRPYEGFNTFYLHHVTGKHGYTTPYFLTFKQAQELRSLIRSDLKTFLSDNLGLSSHFAGVPVDSRSFLSCPGCG